MKFTKYLFIILGILFVDTCTKYLAINNYLNFDLIFIKSIPTPNPGFALGSMENASSLLRVVFYSALGIYIFFTMLLALYLMRFQKAKLLKVSLVLFSTGILGNTIDKTIYGYVIDFINLFPISNYVFNLADVSMLSGAILIPIAIYKEYDLIVHQENKRGSIFIYPKFQRDSFLLTVSSILFSGLVFLVFAYALLDSSDLSIEDSKEILYIGSIVFSIFNSIIFTFLSVYHSHKVLGPQIALRNFILNSNNKDEIKFREGDYSKLVIECYEAIKKMQK